MINKNNKNFQITLDPESAQILESLAVRFKTSKSIIIRNALKVYAGHKKHYIKLNYSTLQEVEQTELKSSSIQAQKPMTEEDDKQWNNFLNELDNFNP